MKKMKNSKKEKRDEEELANMFDDEAEEVDGEEEEEEDGEKDEREEEGEDIGAEDGGQRSTKYNQVNEEKGGRRDVMDLAAEDDEDEGREAKDGRKALVKATPAVRPYNVVRIPPMKAQPAFQPNCGPSIEAKRYLGAFATHTFMFLSFFLYFNVICTLVVSSVDAFWIDRVHQGSVFILHRGTVDLTKKTTRPLAVSDW